MKKSYIIRTRGKVPPKRGWNRRERIYTTSSETIKPLNKQNKLLTDLPYKYRFKPQKRNFLLQKVRQAFIRGSSILQEIRSFNAPQIFWPTNASYTSILEIAFSMKTYRWLGATLTVAPTYSVNLGVGNLCIGWCSF